MPKPTLEQTVAEAAKQFALQVVEAVKAATLQELVDLNSNGAPGKPRTVAAERTPAAPKKKKKRRNYPKCAFPGCTNNRFVRGKGFCGVHWKEFLAGKIGSAESYTKGEEAAPSKRVVKRPAKKAKTKTAKPPKRAAKRRAAKKK